MSATATTVMQPPLTASSFHTTLKDVCDKCGADLSHPHLGVAEDAQRRIVELEAQVKILTGKATAAGNLVDISFESPLDQSRILGTLDPCGHGRWTCIDPWIPSHQTDG